MGSFPYFILDGDGGALFAWYSNGPSLQVFAQHIDRDGQEVFAHNGAVGSTNPSRVRVSPSISYRAETDETFIGAGEQIEIDGDDRPIGARRGRLAGFAEWNVNLDCSLGR